MIIARWQIDVRFGHKQAALQSMKRWGEEIGARAGFDPSRSRTLVGHIGAGESTVQHETEFRDLGELEAAFEKLGSIDAHKSWGKELEPHVVSGSNRWEIYRVS